MRGRIAWARARGAHPARSITPGTEVAPGDVVLLQDDDGSCSGSEPRFDPHEIECRAQKPAAVVAKVPAQTALATGDATFKEGPAQPAFDVVHTQPHVRRGRQ